MEGVENRLSWEDASVGGKDSFMGSWQSFRGCLRARLTLLIETPWIGATTPLGATRLPEEDHQEENEDNMCLFRELIDDGYISCSSGGGDDAMKDSTKSARA